MPIFCTAKAWEEYGIKYAVHKELWRNCVLATLGPQPDKGTTARDFSGQRNHGTLTGATHLPTWSNQSYRGQAFRALTFDGTEDYVITTIVWSLLSGDNSHTICGWFYCTSLTNDPVLAANSQSNASRWFVELAVPDIRRTLDRVIFGCGDQAGNIQWESPVSLLNAWRHVVICKTGATTAAVYVDGSPAAYYQTISAGIKTTPTVANCPLWLGKYAVASYELSGMLASWKLYSRILTASEISTLARHPLAAYEVRLPEFFFGASTAVTLTVAGSAVDVTSDSPTLTQHNTLAVGNAVCSVTSGNVALVQHSALTVQSSQLATSSQSPALTQHNALTVADSKCVVSSETLALTQHSALTVQGSVCAVTAGNIALTQHAALTVQDCSVALNSQSPVLAQHSVLAVGDSQCAATSQEVTLTQHGALVVENAICAVTSDNIELTAYAPAVVTLTVHGSTCVVASTSPVLTQHVTVIVAASQCLVSSGNVTLAYHAAGAALILEHQTLLLAI